MMNDEEYLNSKMQHRNPFTVPEGYFEQLTAQVMERLPQQQEETSGNARQVQLQPARKPLVRQLRPWLYAAACLVVGAFVAAIAFNRGSDDGTQHMQAATGTEGNASYYSDTYIEEEANYAMVDNQEIYAYLLAEM